MTTFERIDTRFIPSTTFREVAARADPGTPVWEEDRRLFDIGLTGLRAGVLPTPGIGQYSSPFTLISPDYDATSTGFEVASEAPAMSLPACLPLLLAGLGGRALLRRRKV